MNNEVKELLTKFTKDLMNIKDIEGSDLKLQTLGDQFSLLFSLDYKNQSKSSDYGLTATYNKETDSLAKLFEAEN